MRDRFVLPVKLRGGGFRPALERAQFLNTASNVAPQSLATKLTRGLWPSLDSAFGAGSFSAENAATRLAAFYFPWSRYALELQSEWGRLQHARNNIAAAAGLATPIRIVLDTSAI